MRYTYIFFIFLNLVTSVNLINTIVTKKNTAKFIFIFIEALEVLKFGFLFFLFYSDYILTPYFYKWIVFIELLTVPYLFIFSNILNLKKHKKKFLYGFCILLTVVYFLVMNACTVRVVKLRGIGYIISMVGVPYFYEVYIVLMILIICMICLINFNIAIPIKYMVIELIIAFACIIESALFIFNGQFFMYQMIGELLLNLYFIYLIERPK